MLGGWGMMKEKDLEELVRLLGDLRRKWSILSGLFPGGVPLGNDTGLTRRQIEAIGDFDKAWEKFRHMARLFGGSVD
jgi:hypothetical protein